MKLDTGSLLELDIKVDDSKLELDSVLEAKLEDSELRDCKLDDIKLEDSKLEEDSTLDEDKKLELN